MRTIHRTLRLAAVVLVAAACGTPSASLVAEATATLPTPVVATPTTAAPSEAAASTQPSPLPPSVLEAMETYTSEGRYQIRCRDQEAYCAIVGLDVGTLEPVWAVPVAGPCPHLLTGGDGEVYVACSSSGGTAVHLIDPDGRPRDGWPRGSDQDPSSIRHHDFSLGCGVNGSPLQRSSDGTVYVAVAYPSGAVLIPLNIDLSAGGWPISFPGDDPVQDGFGGNGCRGYIINEAAGRIVLWGYEDIELEMELDAARTEFTAIDFKGQTILGWPRGSVGAASAPVVAADGGIAYTSATGKVWSHGPGGFPRLGWPYEPPPETDLGTVSAPVGAPDGHVAVTTGSGDTTALHLIQPDGRLVTGTPIGLRAPIETRCLMGDTPCAGTVPPLFGPDGTLYVALGGGDDADPGGTIIAIAADGSVVDGWPVALGAGRHALSMRIGPERDVQVDGVACSPTGCADGESTPLIMMIAPDGRIVAD